MYSQSEQDKGRFLQITNIYTSDPDKRIIGNFLDAMKNLEGENAEKAYYDKLEKIKKDMEEWEKNLEAAVPQEEYKSQLDQTRRQMINEITTLFQKSNDFYNQCYALAIAIVEDNPEKKLLAPEALSELKLLTRCVKFQRHILSDEEITPKDLEIGTEIQRNYKTLEILHKDEKTMKRIQMWNNIMATVSVGLFIVGALAIVAGSMTIPFGGGLAVVAGVAAMAAAIGIAPAAKFSIKKATKKEKHIQTGIKLHEYHGRMIASKETKEKKEPKEFKPDEPQIPQGFQQNPKK